MENATKALLIAGGVLITILILSAGVYLYTAFSNQSKEYSAIISETELQKFNSKFDIYVARQDVSAQEVATIVNLSREYNGQVNIEIYNSGNVRQVYTTPENFVMKFLNSSFSCIDVQYDNNTAKITKLTFKENR